MSWLSDTLGSVAGSVLGSAVQNHYNSANAAQANAWNVENYKHRYQWAVDDMRKAGLNPILAATNGIGGSISGASAASVGMSDIGSTMNSARAASAAERQAKNAENLSVSQIDKNAAEADSMRQRTHGIVLENGILANDLNLREQTYEKRLGYELEKMNLELENLRLQGSYLNSGVLIEDNYQQRYAGFNPNSSESYIIFEFLQDKNMEKSVKLATLIQKQFKTSARRIDKGVHQAGFLVLRETSMPGVLVELGYISTPDEEQYLLSDTGSEALANSIYKAFLNYKREHDAPIDRSKVQQPEVPELEESVAETPTDEPDSAPEPVRSNRKPDTPNIKTNKSNPEVVHKPIFKIQILASDRILPKNSRQLKGLSPVSYYKEKGLYKYTYGESTDYNKVLRMKREVTAKFKDAFIIAFKNGEKMNVNEAIKEFKKNR
jgi:N-acetylmuramoyl-L-alanine amidase